jgi:two-component system sensor histidine kinase VicK
VINNLISNSLKFTPDGGTISINLEERGEVVRISVSDTGIGIPEEYRESLFDKFSKARRPGLRGEASVGLGMSIIKTIVEWHQGKIWFDTEVNRGTTFCIEIPASK